MHSWHTNRVLVVSLDAGRQSLETDNLQSASGHARRFAIRKFLASGALSAEYSSTLTEQCGEPLIGAINAPSARS